MEGMATKTVTLTEEEFALLYRFLDLEHTETMDPDEVGLITKLGKQLWDRVQEVAVEQGFTPTHDGFPDRHTADPS